VAAQGYQNAPAAPGAASPGADEVAASARLGPGPPWIWATHPGRTHRPDLCSPAALPAV